MTGAITVAICEDHEVFRREFLVAVERDPQLHVIAEADVPGHLGPLVNERPPNVLCLDLTTPLGDPVDGVRRLVAALPLTAILVLMGPTDDPAEALVAGAAGAVQKETAIQEAPAIIHTLAAGNVYLDDAAAKSVLAFLELYATTEAGIEVGPLTPAQLELLHQIGSGRDLEELASFFEIDTDMLQQRLWETLHALREQVGTESIEELPPSAMAPILEQTQMLPTSPTGTGTNPPEITGSDVRAPGEPSQVDPPTQGSL